MIKTKIKAKKNWLLKCGLRIFLESHSLVFRHFSSSKCNCINLLGWAFILNLATLIKRKRKKVLIILSQGIAIYKIQLKQIVLLKCFKILILTISTSKHRDWPVKQFLFDGHYAENQSKAELQFLHCTNVQGNYTRKTNYFTVW